MALEYFDNWNNSHQVRRQSSEFNLPVPAVTDVSGGAKDRIQGLVNRQAKRRLTSELESQQNTVSKGQQYMNIFGNQNDEFRTAELETVTRDPNAPNRYNVDAAATDLKKKLESSYATKGKPRNRIADTSASTEDNIGHEMMVRFTKELGLKPFQAAALVGNANYETGNFKFMDELEPEVLGSKGGINIFQYTGLKPGLRRYNFEKYAKEKGLNTRDFKSGIEFSIHELTKGDQKRVLKELLKAETPQEANKIVVEQYLKPNPKKTNMSARETLTLEYAGAYKSSEAFE
tara:strand:+ start:1074 stop:1940 length:867 start_codon:yes stop_codon:yes gene_type:complete